MKPHEEAFERYMETKMTAMSLLCPDNPYVQDICKSQTKAKRSDAVKFLRVDTPVGDTHFLPLDLIAFLSIRRAVKKKRRTGSKSTDVLQWELRVAPRSSPSEIVEWHADSEDELNKMWSVVDL